MREVKGVFKNFLFEVDTTDRQPHQVETTLTRMISLKFSETTPKESSSSFLSRKPPCVVILGPPGSGRTTQSKLVADQFGLVCVSVRDLIAEQSTKTPELG